MSPFLYNLLVFSPLLLLAGGILYLLDTRSRPPPPPPLLPPIPEFEEEDEEVEIDPEPAEPETPDAPEAAPEDPPAPLAPTGTAAPTAPRAPRTRVVGTKKLRSIERRDRRRAYHEHLHNEAAQRAEALQALREEEEATRYDNARRRFLAEEEILARRDAERSLRLVHEAQQKIRDDSDAATVVTALNGAAVVELEKVAERLGRSREWVEGVVRRERLVGVRESGEVTAVTREGVWVCFQPEAVRGLWRMLEERGRMEWSEVGEVMEALLVEGGSVV